MKLKEALQELVNGKKVRCKKWVNKECYIHMVDNHIRYHDGTFYDIVLNQIYDTDWEVYGEQKKPIDELNESWAKFMRSNENITIEIIDMIEKILQYLNEKEKP